MLKQLQTSFSPLVVVLCGTIFRQISGQTLNYETIGPLQSEIDLVFQSRGANCITVISSEGYGNTILSYLPAIQVLIHNNEKNDKSTLLTESLEMCPFLLATSTTNETTTQLLQTLSHQLMPQKVLLILYLRNIDHSSSSIHFFSGNPNAIVVSPMKDDNSLVLWRPRLHPQLLLEEVAVWNGTSIIETSKHPKVPNKSSLQELLFDPAGLSLHGDHLRASAVAYEPFYIPGGGRDGQDAGIEVELVKTIVQSIGGEVDIGPPTDGGIWGSDKDGDGVFNGMVGDLQAKRVEVGFSQLFVKHERLALMDFTIQYDYDYRCFLVQKPPLLPHVLAIIRPFDTLTWFLIGCTMMMAVIFLLLNSNLHAKRKTHNDNCVKFNAGTSSLYVFSLAMIESHSYTFRPAKVSMRMGMASLLLGFFIISRAYSGGLVAFLSVPLTQTPINTLQELAMSGTPTASLFGSSYLKGRYSANEYVLSLADDHLAFRDFDIGFENYTRGEFFLYQSKQFLENEIRIRLTDNYGETFAHIVQECPESFHVALGLTKHSPYTAPFNHRIRQLSEAGLIIKWTRDYMERAGHLSAQSSNSPVAVEPLLLDELLGPFQFFAGLLLACVAAFILEHMSGLRPLCGRRSI